jgi:hypothetical protein
VGNGEVVKFEVTAEATDLHKVEALVAALARQMGSTRDQAASVIRNLETQRRRPEKARDDVKPRVVIGKARAYEIRLLLEKLGWSLRETVERKLPLLKLPSDLKDAVRRGRLEPSKALILGRLRNEAERKAQLEEILARGTSVRKLQGSPQAKGRALVDEVVKEDLRALELHVRRELGLDVRLNDHSMSFHFSSDTDMLDWLEQALGMQPF